MKFFFINFLLINFSINLSAQANHFIYFQTENRDPFYIKVDNKILSSSITGYLILSKLKEGTYAIAFGFPKNSIQEQLVNCTVTNKDQGYLIKNLDDKGWSLFNLQTFEIIKAHNKLEENDKDLSRQNQTDAFSNMLANVVKDSTIREKEIIEKDTQIVFHYDDSVIKVKPLAATQLNQIQNNKDFIVQDSESSNPAISVIKRKLKKRNKDGIDLIYLDETGDQKDTIRIFFPSEKNDRKSNIANENIDTDKHSIETVQINPRQNPSIQENIKIQQSISNDTTLSQANKSNISSGDTVKYKLNQNCKAHATEEDFFKLRKKMVEKDNDDDMIIIAKKIFRTKCFSTMYIKNLSTLFLNDVGKYNFFDAAYPFVSDSNLFSTLVNQLSDPYYINRFKAMIY